MSTKKKTVPHPITLDPRTLTTTPQVQHIGTPNKEAVRLMFESIERFEWQEELKRREAEKATSPQPSPKAGEGVNAEAK